MVAVGASKRMTLNEKIHVLSTLGHVSIHGFDGRRWYVNAEFKEENVSHTFRSSARDSLTSAIDEVMEEALKVFNED